MGRFFNQVVMNLKRIPGSKTMEQMRKNYNERIVDSQKETETGTLSTNKEQSIPDVLPARKRGRKRKADRL